MAKPPSAGKDNLPLKGEISSVTPAGVKASEHSLPHTTDSRPASRAGHSRPTTRVRSTTRTPTATLERSNSTHASDEAHNATKGNTLNSAKKSSQKPDELRSN